MFNLNLREDEILMKITVNKDVTNRDTAMNFIGNMITRAGGDVASKVHVILTKNTIYLEYIGHVSLGYAEETRKIEEIQFNDLKEFVVTAKETEEGLKEEIKITTKNEELIFLRNNSNNDNLALAMAKLIEDIR